MPNYDTLETAQARILELEEELQTARTEQETLSENNKQLTERVEELRTLNQKYFLKLSASHVPPKEPENDPEPVPTCEEFATTINI